MSTPSGKYPDDDLYSAFTGDEQKAKRKAEIQQWFEDFKEFCLRDGGVSIEIASNVIDLINEDYWSQMSESVRIRICPPNGKSVRADRHKIASLFELLIVHHQPFLHPESSIQIDLNARAAFFVATNIIGNWGYVNSGDLYVSQSFDREHRTWLIQLNEHSEGLPIFSNAATWYLVELLFIERSSTAQATVK